MFNGQLEARDEQRVTFSEKREASDECANTANSDL